MLAKNPPVSPGVESPIVKIHWWPRRLLSRMARNSFRRAANQNSGSENSRKETNVEVWSRREYWRTAERTPTMTASTTATTMASDTRRAVTSRWVQTMWRTGNPSLFVPKSPRRTWLNQNQYRPKKPALRWSSASLARMTAWGTLGRSRSSPRGSPELIPRTKANSEARTSTGIEMRIRRKVKRRTSVATLPSPVAGHGQPPGGGRPSCRGSLLLGERPLVHIERGAHLGDVVDHVLVLGLVDEQGGLLE